MKKLICGIHLNTENKNMELTVDGMSHDIINGLISMLGLEMALSIKPGTQLEDTAQSLAAAIVAEAKEMLEEGRVKG